MHTIHRLCRICIQQNLPQVNIARGPAGFGFTICCDAPVRVQSVEPGGPAQQAGLQSSDCILQMNGLPVESWACRELAQAIRSCDQELVVVVWRSGAGSCRPQTYRKLLPTPPNSKHGRQRGTGWGAGSLCPDRKCEEPTAPLTATLKGTRVTSSNGDNYIILSPVSPESATDYRDSSGALRRLYQTQPNRGQQTSHLLTAMPAGLSRQPFTSHTATLPDNHGDYQNCTLVQSHLVCPGFGTYVTLAPKTLIFPVFVQPLDLCRPDRWLMMSEDMTLHQGAEPACKVTVLIYSDLMLLTRADEGGQLNVLQSPLYLHTLRIHHESDPLRVYVWQCVCERWQCVCVLEASSLEQSCSVSLCLHDNIAKQMSVSLEINRTQEEQAGLPHSTSCPPQSVRNRREEEQGKSCDQEVGALLQHTSPQQGAARGQPGDPSPRRSLSEGSLLQEPWSPLYLSNSTLPLLPPSLPDPPSLRRELTKEGGSLPHFLHFLYGRKVPEKRNNTKPFPGEVLEWTESFDALLASKYGLAVFRHFLRSEFSEENLDFWCAVEKYKGTQPLNKMAATAEKIFHQFISTGASRQVNVDSSIREVTYQSLCKGPGPASFQEAQDQIYSLMESDSYPRFLKSRLYCQLANQDATQTQLTNQGRPASVVGAVLPW